MSSRPGQILLTSLTTIALILTSAIAYAGSVTYIYDELNRLRQVGYEDGTVIQYFYDEAGNRFFTTTDMITISSGAAYTNSRNVTLALSCNNPQGCSHMKFSNDNITYSGSYDYATTMTWTLSEGDGIKTVYVKFQDTAGTWSDPYTDIIYLDSVCSNAPVKIGSASYASLQEAYNYALDGQTVQSRNVTFNENLTINRNITLTLQGGYNCSFTGYSGNMTTVKGMIRTMTGGGTATIRNFILEN